MLLVLLTIFGVIFIFFIIKLAIHANNLFFINLRNDFLGDKKNRDKQMKVENVLASDVLLLTEKTLYLSEQLYRYNTKGYETTNIDFVEMFDLHQIHAITVHKMRSMPVERVDIPKALKDVLLLFRYSISSGKLVKVEQIKTKCIIMIPVDKNRLTDKIPKTLNDIKKVYSQLEHSYSGKYYKIEWKRK